MEGEREKAWKAVEYPLTKKPCAPKTKIPRYSNHRYLGIFSLKNR
jgi:hypothetical protein